MVFNYRLILLLLLSSTAMGQSLAPSGNYNTLSVFNGGTKSTRAMIAPKGFQPWATYDTTGFIWLDTVNHFLYYHNGTSRVQVGAGGGGSGTVTNVSTGFGMLGGPITTTGTVRVDSNVMMTLARGYKVSDSVAGLIPSVSGYQLYTDTNTFDATKANLNAGLAGKQNYTDTSTFDATRSWITTNYVPYTGATDSVRLGENQIRAGQVAFDLSPTGSQVISGMYWDATNNTISVPLTTDVNLQIGQESLVRARNNTGSTVTNGSVVYISGAQGNNPTIALADADSARTSEVIGVATEDIGINATGFVTVSGVVNGVNTSSWNAGDKLYLSTTNGQLTNSQPSAPHISVLVATALNSTNNGRIFVSPSQPIATDTNLLNGTTVPPTQYAVKSYVQSQGYGTGTIKALTGDVTASGTGTVTATLVTVNASPATYTNATVTVDSKGRVTSASSGTAPVTSVSGTSGRISSTGGTTPVLDLVTVNATPATYGGASAIPVVTVDAYGRATTITTVSPATNGTVTSVGSGFGLSGGTITTTGTLRVDTASVPTQYRVDTTAFNALTRINTKGTVSSVALANGFGLSISGSPVTGTGTITATVDTTKVATKADVNAKGNGTVTSIQLVAGTGVSITPTTAVTTSGTYTISATGSTGVQSVTSTGSTAIISGTTTVNVEVDTTHPFTFTGNNTFSRDITIDSATFGTGNGLSTNIKIGRTALSAPTTATGVVAIGENACRLITTGINNIAIGRNAVANSSVSVNGLVAVGTNNLNFSTGDNNTALGFQCMARAVAWNGIANAGVGANSGNALTSGSSNSWLGAGAGNALTSGSSNTFVGVNSGNVITTGGQNTIIGAFTGNSGGLDIRTLSNRVVLSDGGANIRAYHNGTNWLIGTVTDGSTGILQLSGNLGLNTAGNKINIATGANASIGTATLVAGTVTVNTTAVTASSIIILTGVSTGAPPCASCGALSVGTITAGTSFVINSALSTDTRVVNYIIYN